MSAYHELDDDWEIVFEDTETMILRNKVTGKMLRCRKHSTH